MRILVVEDSVTMRKVMEMTFAGEQAELLAVESGELALQQGPEFGPDVAFIDASLPGMDGYELTRVLKGNPQLAGTSVILMASQHRPFDEGRASEVGVDDHLLKPFDTQEALDKASALAGGVDSLSEAPSIPVARAVTPQPTPIGAPAYRPTPPPLPVNPPSLTGRAMSRTPLSGAPVSMVPSSSPRTAPPPAAMPALKSQSSRPAPAAATHPLSHSVVERLEALGLTPQQVEGVMKLSAEVVERVVWEVVPELAEAMIAEELHRLVGD